jgi:hypothetical protein
MDGTDLRALRQALGLSRAELGAHWHTIDKWERGDRLARLEVLLTEMDRRMELRVEQLEKRMGEGFAAVHQRIGDVVHRMDALDTRPLATEGRITVLEQRFEAKADKWTSTSGG